MIYYHRDGTDGSQLGVPWPTFTHALNYVYLKAQRQRALDDIISGRAWITER